MRGVRLAAALGFGSAILLPGTPTATPREEARCGWARTAIQSR